LIVDLDSSIARLGLDVLERNLPSLPSLHFVASSLTLPQLSNGGPVARHVVLFSYDFQTLRAPQLCQNTYHKPPTSTWWTTKSRATPPSRPTSRHYHHPPNAQSCKSWIVITRAQNSTLTLSSQNMEDTFDAVVGVKGAQKRFTLHTDFFIPRSEFFRAARSATWNKDSQKPTTLDDDDDDPEVFAIYMRCVYLGNVNFLPDPKEIDFIPLIKAYVIADKLGDLMTANMIIDRIISYSDEVNMLAGVDQVELLYNFTASGSPLRALVCDHFIHEADSQYLLKGDLSEIDREFFQDIALRYLSIKRADGNTKLKVSVGTAFGQKVSTVDACPLYHQHNKNHPRHLCTPSQTTPAQVVKKT